jgi:hypothetical protein
VRIASVARLLSELERLAISAREAKRIGCGFFMDSVLAHQNT